MDIRRIKVPVAQVWATPTTAKADQTYLRDGDLAAWLEQSTPEDRQRIADDDLVVTQALFNDRVILDKIKGDWAHVLVTRQGNRTTRRGYPGWVPLTQLTVTDSELDYPTTTVRLVRDQTVLLADDGTTLLTLPLGTILTTTGQDDHWIAVQTPLGHGKVATAAAVLAQDAGSTGERLLRLGQNFLATPYLWGGITPLGFDCSGLTYALHRALGIAIPRDADDQFTNGYPIAPEALEPGDLVFFARAHGTGSVHHVGIYAGNGQMLHAPKPGETVTLAPLANGKTAAEYVGARRFW